MAGAKDAAAERGHGAAVAVTTYIAMRTLLPIESSCNMPIASTALEVVKLDCAVSNVEDDSRRLQLSMAEYYGQSSTLLALE